MHQPLSEALGAMVARSDAKTVRLDELLHGTEERGMYLVMILLALPFITPIPLPGFATVIGFAVMVMSLRLAWRLPPRLPGFIGRREISRDRMAAFVRSTAGALRKIEKVVRPRFSDWLKWRTVRFFNSLLLALMGVLLALPLPPVLPFSNSLPSWGIIFVSLSIIERDGILIWAGYAVSLGTLIYMTFFTGAVIAGLEKLFAFLGPAMGLCPSLT
jgi:hypothetical protein